LACKVVVVVDFITTVAEYPFGLRMSFLIFCVVYTMYSKFVNLAASVLEEEFEGSSSIT